MHDPSEHAALDATFYERDRASRHYCHRTNYRVQTLKVTKLVDIESRAILDMHCSTTLKTHDMTRKPDDYLVNLQIDEAASVVVSEPMRKFLKEGREFRLSLGLMTQFSKQIEHEGSRGVYMNVLNNVRTTIAGNITLDSELAESFSHEEMDAMEAKHRLRNMANGEWMIDTMNPGWGEGQPQPFSIQAMEIPAGPSRE